MSKLKISASIALAAAAAAALAACGTSNSANRTPGPQTVTVTSPTGTPTQRQPPLQTSPSTTTTAPQQTRTAPGPAFTRTTGGTLATPSSELQGAVATLSARGFTPVNRSTYRASETLRVLVGSRPGAEQAFFFDGARFLGSDASGTSRRIAVVGQSDTAVTLAYSLSTGVTRSVRFQLDMGRLMALDPIPSAAQRR